MLPRPAAAEETNVYLECGTLLQLINQTGGELSNVFRSDIDDLERFAQVSTITAEAATNFETLDLTDEQLKQYQDRFVQVYLDLSDVSGRLSDAEQAQDDESIQTIYDEFRQTVRPEWELVQETRTYCRPR
jgi:hypothetical protein